MPISELDRCVDEIASQNQRVDLAARASAELLDAVAANDGGRSGRLARAASVVDRWLAYESGCSFENDYCAAPEIEEAAALSGCHIGTAPMQRGSMWILLVPGMALLLFRTGRIRRRILRCCFVVAFTSSMSVAALAQDAELQEERAADNSEEESDDAADAADVAEEREASAFQEVLSVRPMGDETELIVREIVDPKDGGRPIDRGVGIYFGASGALDQAAAALAFGLRFDVAHWFILGVDGEYMPWFSLEAGQAERGSAQAAATLIFQWATVGMLEVRTTVQAGASVLLFDLPAANRGSVGAFAGITPIGIAFRVHSRLRIIVDPGGIYLAAPQLQGVPLLYRHHRFTVGLRWTPWAFRD